MSTSPSATFTRIRKHCLALEDVSERDSHGSPTFFVREKRSFLSLAPSYYGPEGRPAIVCAAPEGAQSALVEAKPELYFLPKYVAKLGWIGMWLDRGAPWAEIASILDAGHASVVEKLAPVRAAKAKTKKTK